MKHRFVIMLGPQASGKGTQAEMLSSFLGVPHISIGNIFRREVSSGSALGRELKEFMDRGELIPERLNDSIVRGVVESHPEGMILDGYPRTIKQARFLDSIVKVDLVILLEVPDSVSIERISGRLVCSNGHDFHIKYKPPKKEGVCDFDGLPLHRRDDDNPAAVKKRLAIYHEETEPLIDYYENKGLLLRVDGTKSIDGVFNSIIRAIG